MLSTKQCLHLLVLLALMGAGDAREVPGLGHYDLHQAVPVIHLTEEQYSGKASVGDYLRMFPNELLASNKRVKPIDVRKIEHEDFIDYEIEFIELPAHEEKETGTEEFILKTESSNSNNKIQNDSLNNQDTAKKSEKSKELNLVNFVDLVRKSKTKSNPSRSRGFGDRRRRRRIKLKREPGRLSLARDINDSSNQINTEQTKRDQNNFSETHVFSKPRTIIRNLIQLPETVRKSSVLDRRTTVHRVPSFRARKRIPLKSGRSFYRDDKPSDQLIRLRNSEIIAKLERSTFKERNVIRTKARSEDDLDDKESIQTEDETVKQRNMTESHEDDEEQKTRNVLTEGPGVNSERELTEPPPSVMSRAAVPLKITTTRSPSTETTSSPLMMYPEVFTTRPQDIPVTEVAGSHFPLPGFISDQLETTVLPLPLISVFGSKPHSSRLQISPDVETEVQEFPVFTTVSSALKFSIISTSTQTSLPMLEPTTQPVLTSAWQSERSNAKTSTTKSTTISLPTPTTTLGTESEAVSTTTSEDWMRVSMTEMTDSNPDPTTQQTLQDESKFQEVTTTGDPGSITTDNQMTTTPVPDDLQLSESITSVYLHNASLKQSVVKDIKTSETPNKETVNSIKMLAYSKPTPAPAARERIFTVTPVSVTSTTTMTPLLDGQYHEINPGPYQHDAVGDTAEPYVHDHRAHYEHDPTGDTAPPYQHDPSGEMWTEPREEMGKEEDRYSNLDSTYPGDYEVNEVKVDFDRQDEHKIYNVQAKAGDFIIGEVGRIDINNGQTVEGVRYTALEGEVDPLRIAEILNRFFGARTASS